MNTPPPPPPKKKNFLRLLTFANGQLLFVCLYSIVTRAKFQITEPQKLTASLCYKNDLDKKGSNMNKR